MRRVFRIPFSRTRVEREFDDELAFHLETRVDRLVAQGMTPDDARREALRQFGDVDTVRRDVLVLDTQREAAARRATILSDARQDLAYALRTLRRNAGFTALVVGGLALGIGANAAIYSVINAVLIRTLPVAHPDQLITIGAPDAVESFGQGRPGMRLFSYPLYRDVRDNNHVFTGVLATGRTGRLDVAIDSTRQGKAEAEHPRGRFVSANYFSVLGLRAAIGRTLDSTADLPGAAPQATISHAYWTRRFHNDSSIIGRAMLVNNVRVAITGVAPPGFSGEVVGVNADIWLPIGTHDLLAPTQRVLDDRRQMWLLLIGRARPGITVEQARQQIEPVIKSSIFANASARDLTLLNARPLESFVSSGARGLSAVRSTFAAPLVTLMAGVALLLCIVCVNVANLLLARGIARRREMSLRLAIGANRSRIVRQLLTESLLLALASGAAALIVGWWGSLALVTLASDGAPVSLSMGPSANVLAFTLALSIGSVMLFGLVPALRTSRVDLAAALRGQSRSVAQGARFGVALITGQVALSLVLLAGASMLTRNLHGVQSTDLGLDRDHLIQATLDIRRRDFDVPHLATYAEALRDRVAAVPGVAAVTYSENGLYTGSSWSSTIQVPGFEPQSSADLSISNDEVGPDYARGIGARLIAGRDLTRADQASPALVTVVTESFARFFFSGRNAVGQFVRIGDPGEPQEIAEIVGVVADARGQTVYTPPAHWAHRMYFPFVREHAPTERPEQLRLLVRTTADPSATMQAVRSAIVSVDRTVVLDGIEPLAALVRVSIRGERLVARIATALGALALILAAIGLYGVTSYTIARRTAEIGVRVALGAQSADVAAMILTGALRPVLIGIVIGTPLASVAMRLLQRNLSNVSLADPASVAIAVAVLAASAVVAAAAPARRAMRIDPVAALREE